MKIEETKPLLNVLEFGLAVSCLPFVVVVDVISINCEGGRQIKSFESFSNLKMSDGCCCCQVCHIYPDDVVVVVRLSLTLDLGMPRASRTQGRLSVWWQSRVC